MTNGVQINSELIQTVRDAVDIVEVAGGLTRLQRKGKRYQGLCPFHKEKTPSFSVDPDQGLYYCFGCGAGGDAIKLFMEQTGDDFPAAIEALARQHGIPLPTSRVSPQRQRQSQDRTQALEAAAEYFQRQLEKSETALGYLSRRRISEDLRRQYGLGYAPDGWRNLLQELRRTLSLETLIAVGLVGKSERSGEPYDRFRNRLMFPIHLPSGRLVGFGGRTLGDDRAKYINTSETESFHKGKLLYGFHLAKRALRDDGRALLVEGYFDVLGAAASGIPWAVAGMGTALTAEQARLLGRYCENVVVGYDGDSAGEGAFHKALPILLGAGLGVRRARFPEGHDPDSLRVEKGPQAVLDAVDQAEDGVRSEIERLIPTMGTLDPQRRAQVAGTLGELLRPIRDSIVRYDYGKLAAERLGVPLELLWKRVGGAAQKPSGGQEEAPRKAREVRSAEEKAVALLLQPGAPLPPPDQLPPKEVFFDAECRNIYATFCALYRGGDQVAPAGDVVIAHLDREGGAVGQAARFLLEVSDSGEENPQETLDHLLDRWRKQRNPVLMREIRLAEQEGDHDRLAQLLEEKRLLARSLHPEMDGKL